MWIYTPLVLEAALALEPTTLVYDVMDDLAAFRNAAPELLVLDRDSTMEAVVNAAVAGVAVTEQLAEAGVELTAVPEVEVTALSGEGEA